MDWLELQEFRGNASASSPWPPLGVALEILLAIVENYWEPFAAIPPSQYVSSNVKAWKRSL
jgi:hypothetical protein